MTRLKSEDHALELIDEFFPREHPALLLGRGDDCAEFASAAPLALSTDLFLDNVHFRRSYFTPEEIGHKALAVNLSDLASAGARPLGFSLALMCPPDLDREYLAGIFRGMSQLAARFNVPLSGGDITAAPTLGFSITVWGASQAANFEQSQAPFFLRRGAEAGDVLFFVSPIASGGLGLARLGLELLEARGRAALSDYPAACAALLRPQPMLEAGRALMAVADESGGRQRINAMDMSDGLRRDLPRLLAGRERNQANGTNSATGTGARLGADLDFALSDLHPELQRFYASRPDNRSGDRPPSSVLSGGDEYGLLCACPPAGFSLVRETLTRTIPGISALRLGNVVERPGIRWRGSDISVIADGSGFDHFGG